MPLYVSCLPPLPPPSLYLWRVLTVTGLVRDLPTFWNWKVHFCFQKLRRCTVLWVLECIAHLPSAFKSHGNTGSFLYVAHSVGHFRSAALSRGTWLTRQSRLNFILFTAEWLLTFVQSWSHCSVAVKCHCSDPEWSVVNLCENFVMLMFQTD